MRSGKSPFKGRQFTTAVILWAVRWYFQFLIRAKRVRPPPGASSARR
ncbi:transposase-like protein [Azospirillum sp. OGB3]|nr:hypothetical protein [Azospirillum sp. OGB3]MBB3268830.1 transposase-like protein [Azospirillum sp. OGB3]